MNTLIAYYSRTGHNEQLAQQLHEQMPSDLDQIMDMKKRDSMAGCGFAAFFKRKTKIEFAKDPSAYDRVVVVTPFWAGSLPPATRTYLQKTGANLKQFALLSVCGRGEENPNALADVEAVAGKKPFRSLLIKESELETEATRRQLETLVEQLHQ
jgi:flavodoxin